MVEAAAEIGSGLRRVALCVHGRDEAAVLRAYDLMARGLYTHATPTLFNAGTKKPQMSRGARGRAGALRPYLEGQALSSLELGLRRLHS